MVDPKSGTLLGRGQPLHSCTALEMRGSACDYGEECMVDALDGERWPECSRCPDGKFVSVVDGELACLVCTGRAVVGVALGAALGVALGVALGAACAVALRAASTAA